MDERALRTLIDEVKRGRLSRRRFVQTMVGLGLTAPLASQMLAAAGVAQAQTPKLTRPISNAASPVLSAVTPTCKPGSPPMKR